MRPPRTLFVAIASVVGMAFSPALANPSETVEIKVDLEAPAYEIYRSIREQAWTACKPDTANLYVAARNTARRNCQKELIADVIKQLPSPTVLRLADQDDTSPES